VDYQTGATSCPKCGSSDQVQTARELFDTMNGARERGFQRLNQFQQPGQAQGQNWNNGDDDDYDHYNVEGSDPNLRGNQRRRGDGPDFDFGDSLPDDIGGAIASVAIGFAGRAIGKRMMRAFQEKVLPAVEAKATQAQQQWEQTKAEQDAIVQRYPELRGCLKDKVVFLDGGYQTAPVSELLMPATLAHADDLVARLR
jgi:hypothetical protein